MGAGQLLRRETLNPLMFNLLKDHLSTAEPSPKFIHLVENQKLEQGEDRGSSLELRVKR